MLTGRRLKLQTCTLAAGENPGGKRVAVSIPAGSVVKVLSGPNEEDRMVKVLFEGRALVMFTIDLLRRGIEV
jgi:hypothetical protein